MGATLPPPCRLPPRSRRDRQARRRVRIQLQESAERRQQLRSAAICPDGREIQHGVGGRALLDRRAVWDGERGMVEGRLLPAHPLVGQSQQEVDQLVLVRLGGCTIYWITK